MTRGKIILAGLLAVAAAASAACVRRTSPARAVQAPTGAARLTPILVSKPVPWEGASLSPNGRDIAIVTPGDLSLFRPPRCIAQPDAPGCRATWRPTTPPEASKSETLLQIWSVIAGGLVAEQTLRTVHYHVVGKTVHPGARIGDLFVRYSGDGASLAVFDGQDLDDFRILPAPSGKPAGVTRRIVPMSRTDLRLGPPHDHWLVTDMEMTLDGTKAALQICNPNDGRGSSVRAYNLRSGRLLWERSFPTGCFWSGNNPLSWSPGGRRLAVSLPPFLGGTPHRIVPTSDKNLLVLNGQTGRTIQAIGTGYLAGPVCFTGADTLLTASLNADPRYFAEDTIREWSVETGRLVRDIQAPPQGVHYLLSLSADDRVIVGYIGSEKRVENFLNNAFLEFGVWDYRTGKLIAVSGPIARPKHGPLVYILDPKDIPAFGSSNDRIAMDRDGDAVLVWWPLGDRPFLVYRLPQP